MATAHQPAAAPGRPKWIATVGAIVAVGGLAYTWFSHFNPRAIPEKPPAATAPPSAPPQIAASVSVSGSGAVGVGVMHGGSITVGAPAARPEPVASPSAASPAGSAVKQ